MVVEEEACFTCKANLLAAKEHFACLFAYKERATCTYLLKTKRQGTFCLQTKHVLLADKIFAAKQNKFIL